jgi:putative ABC transport system permease protein
MTTGLLLLISWPNLRRHVLRSTLTIVGIALGVAVFVGINAANRGVLAGFSLTIDRIAGRTELEVTAGDAGFPETTLEKVQSARSVGVAVPVIEAVVETSFAGRGSLLVLAVDLMGDRSLRDYALETGDQDIVDDPLLFMAQLDSVIVSREFSESNGLLPGAQLEVGTATGSRHLTVRGVMKEGGLASAFAGNLAIMDIYAAQKIFGRGRSFDRIDLTAAPGHTVAECREELEGLLGPGFQVAPPSSRGQQFEALIGAYSLMMSISSLFALFIGLFIIHNSFAVAITERRTEIGILRALGATQAQIRGLFLSESALMGAAGSTAGLLAGVLLARGIAVAVGTLVNDVYGVAQQATALTTSPVLLLTAWVVGVATSIVAAIVSAWQASRVDPVHALQKGASQVISRIEYRRRAVLAAVLGVMSAACLMIQGTRTLFYASFLATLFAALLVTPAISIALARAMTPILKRLSPVEGSLAADSLVQSPRRTSATVSALMLSLALVVAFAGMARASYVSITNWVAAALNPDLFVVPSPTIVARTVRFPADMERELTAIAGVNRIQAVREARVPFRGKAVMLLAMPLQSVAETTQMNVIAGNKREMFRVAADGGGIIVSDSLAQLHGLRYGESVDLAAPLAAVKLPIVGIIEDYSDQLGTIMIDSSVFRRFWGDDSVNLFRVYVAPGASAAGVRSRILERYSGQRQVFVLNNRDVRNYIVGITDQWFGLTYVQMCVALLVAILGIVNTLTVSITDRRRELGILRAVGAFNKQIRRTIQMEALCIAGIAVVLGFGYGAVSLYYMLQIVRNDIIGMRLVYEFPFAITLQVTPLILSAAFVAALWPSKSVVRGSLVEALEHE